MCLGVRFSLYLASWLSDFDHLFSVCVVFGPLFPPENGGGGGQGPLDPRLTMYHHPHSVLKGLINRDYIHIELYAIEVNKILI